MALSRATRSEPEMASLLRGFETHNHVCDLVVDGISLWRFLRFEIGLALQNLGLRRIPMTIASLIRALFQGGWGYVRAPRGFRYIGKTSNSGLRGHDGCGRFDVYFDDLIDAVPGGEMSSLDAGRLELNERNAYGRAVFDCTSLLIGRANLGCFSVESHGRAVLRKTSELLVGGLSLAEFSSSYLQRKLNVFKRRTLCDSAAEFDDPVIRSDRRVTIGSGNDSPVTHEVIALPDLHVSVFSACTTIHSGLELQLPLSPWPGYQAVQDLLNEGSAYLLKSPQHLADIVRVRDFGCVSPQTSEYP